MRVAVTTGTFGFQALVHTLLSAQEELAAVCTHMKIQHGKDAPGGKCPWAGLSEDGCLSVEMHEYYTDLDVFLQGADLVVTHAGTGTVIELLKKRIPVIVVPNPALKDGHQEEFSAYLQAHGIAVSGLHRVVEDITSRNFSVCTIHTSGSIWATILPPSLAKTK
ncbi:beta-1,4-N-acetylglucosaminyltransferase [Nematocida sp. AWRm77]|nr:beta-1,4-N-acetylglucosaminyltransferase [Nematocida sp. AWRm77]